MVQKFEIILKGLLLSFRTRGSLIVSVENFYKGPKATKRTKVSVKGDALCEEISSASKYWLTNLVPKFFAGCSKYHVFEKISSTCYVDFVANEFKYLIASNDGNRRYFRQRFALYPFTMGTWCIWSVKCQTLRPYLSIDVLDAQNSNVHDVIHIWKHYGQQTHKLWYDGREACACLKLLQRSRGHENDQLLCVTVKQLKELFRAR